MATKFCLNCDKVINAKRQIGVGTFILAILTCGFWLLLIPFYGKKCPICKGSNFGNKIPAVNTNQSSNIQQADPIEQLKKLQELKNAGTISEEQFNEKKKNLLAKI